MSRIRVVGFALLFVGMVGCAQARGSAGSPRNIITEQEIMATNAATVFDVVARLRGEYLRNRGPNSLVLQSQSQPIVFLKDQEYGPVDLLHDIRSTDVAEIHFYTGPEAVTKFGTKYSAGVIQLLPRPQ